MMKAKDLRNESEEELKSKAEILGKEIYDLRCATDRKSEKPHLVGQKRKERARILTVLREKANKTGK